jgi:hypothetical protein
MGAEMTEWERQMALRGLPPSDSDHGWDFRPYKPAMRWPVGWALLAVAAFSLIVWLLIFFH